jgi:hypothetical protein
MNKQIISYCESLERIVQSVDHILGSDELQDLNYFISQIKDLVESEN